MNVILRAARTHKLPVVLVGVFIALAVAAAPFDTDLHRFCNRQIHKLNEFLDLYHTIGNVHPIIFLALALGAMGKRRTAVELIVTVLIAVALTWALKLPINRTRPWGTPLSFPSGDAALAATLVVPLYALRRWTLPATLFGCLVIALSRVMLNYHWPSDVGAGIALGILAGIAARQIVAARWAYLEQHRLRASRGVWLGVLLGTSLLGGLGLLGDVDDVRFFLMHCGPALGLLVAASWTPWIIRRRFPWHGHLAHASQGHPAPGVSPVATSASSAATSATTERSDAFRMQEQDAPATHGRDARATWLATALILLVVGGLYVGLARPCSLFDRDEPRYAKATSEMIASGNYIEPTFNGDYRLHKPPAIYWLMSASVKLLGRSELAFRMPSILATLATLLVLGRIGRRLAIGGAWPMMILAGSAMMMLAGTWAITDAALLCTIAMAMVLFVDDCLRGPSWPRTLLAGLVWGASLLVKGPVGVAIILASILLTWLMGRGHTKLGRGYVLHLLAMLVISIGALLAWAIPVNIATDGKLLEVVHREFVQRLFEPMTRHGGDYFAAMPIYVPALIVGFFPWIGLLPASTSATLGGRIGGRVGRAVLIGWTVPTFIMMSLVATRLPHYILPMFPALALAAAGVLAARERLQTWDKKLLIHGGRIFAVMAWFAAAVLLAVPTALTVLVYIGLPEMPGVYHASLAAGLVLAAMPLTMRKLHPVMHVRMRAGLTVFGMVVLAATLALVSLPQAEKHQLIKPLAEELNERFPDTPIAVCDFDEPSLMFYLNRPTVIDDDVNRWTIFQWSQREGPGLLITTQDEIDKARKAGLRLGRIRKVASRQGCNYSTGHWVRVIVFERIERKYRSSREATP